MAFVTNHLLSLIVFAPLAGIAVIAVLPRHNTSLIRWIGFLTTLLPLAFTLTAWITYVPGERGDFQFYQAAPWLPSLGIYYRVGVDGLSLPMVLLTALLAPLAALISSGITEHVKAYFILFLLLETAMLGVFVALDLVIFFIFFEFSLVPMMFLIMLWGGQNRNYAGFKFMIYTMVGSVTLLLAFQVIGLTLSSFDLVNATQAWPAFSRSLFGLSADTVKTIAFWGIFLGLAIKLPIWPFHTWLPDAHTEAPTAGSMLLAGVLLKIGGYGFIRILLPLFPEQSARFAPIIALLALVTIVLGALAALAQSDFKRLVAYSSVNHMGLVALGIAVIAAAYGRRELADTTILTANGVILQMFNHGITSAALFLLVGAVYERTHTRDLREFGGLGVVVPAYGGILLVSALASLGLPGLNGFVGEFLLFRGAWPVFTLVTALATLGLLFTGAYLLWTIQRILLGPLNQRWAKLRDISFRETVAVAPLLILMVFTGIWPSWILSTINATVSRLYG
ncbi:MAG: NADH-quinone oxidoreductase subunit M [Chloroflexi bacterium]|nr:NADH-quinone oxidoreductase subunit M [Chloroflexota bacterium]